MSEDNGTVLFAHCVGCMAGQGDCCSHVFCSTLRHGIGETKKLTCTQVKCTWLSLTAVKEVPYASITDIDFRSAKE